MEKKNLRENLQVQQSGLLNSNVSAATLRNLVTITALSLQSACSSTSIIQDDDFATGGKSGSTGTLNGGASGEMNFGGINSAGNGGNVENGGDSGSTAIAGVSGLAGSTNQGGNGGLGGNGGIDGNGGLGGNGGIDGNGGLGGVGAVGGGTSIEECMKPYFPGTVADHPVSFDIYTGNTDRLLSLCVTAALDKNGVSPYKECFERKTVISVDLSERQCPCTFNLVADGDLPQNLVTFVFRNSFGSTSHNNIYYNSAINEDFLKGLAQQNSVTSDVFSSIYGTFVNEQIRCHQSLTPVPANCTQTAPTFTTRSAIFGATKDAVYQMPITEGVVESGSVYYGFIRKPCQ